MENRPAPHAHPAAVGHRVVHRRPKHSNPQLITHEMVEELRQLTPFDSEHLPEENVFVFPTASSTWISMQGMGRTVANCTPAG
jgi:acetate kinase